MWDPEPERSTMANYVGLLSLVLAIMTLRVYAQDQSGFISIDCGSTRSYTDENTDINYVPDANFIETGESKSIDARYKTTNLEKQFENVRSFPTGERNCYTLNPQFVNGTQYLIRARFMYGNYDSLRSLPEFDLYLGVNFWTTVTISMPDSIFTREILQTRSSSNVTHICLVKGTGTPFISALELRLINSTLYPSKTGSLSLFSRVDLGSDSTYRYGADPFDRIWTPVDWSNSVTSLITNQTVYPNDYEQPKKVIDTAITPIDSSQPLQFFIEVDVGVEYYVYFHFAEVSIRTGTQTRKFALYVNESYAGTLALPDSQTAVTAYTGEPHSAEKNLTYSFRMTADSTLPPILNAFEIYQVKYMQQLETDPQDAEAITNIKKTYNLKRSSWQGDPCEPERFTWEGLNCSIVSILPRIVSLNLSSSNLIGEISNYISDLKLLKTLDLSNNNLVGTVPDFLSRMTSLTYINLKGNNLNGIVPADLAAKSRKGSLELIVDDKLCLSDPCNKNVPPGRKKPSLLVPIIASVVGLIIIVVVVLLILRQVNRNTKRKTVEGIPQNNTEKSEASVPAVIEEMPRGTVLAPNKRIQNKNKCFTAAEVSDMTNNFSEIIGKGGFGTVYLGVKDGVQVAVKILSQSSTQGYKEFQAEAELLMTVHHRNLISLIGYCDEGATLGLIYEFMPNGNLGSRISDKSLDYLSWGERLKVALDVAQGLEYLHNGCKLSIVHRDIKPSNILLNEKFEAKLADFGLSRASSADSSHTYFSPTLVAGTFGYLDPEYCQTEQLNKKNDVFGFGIVLLEIITSRPVLSNPPERIHISAWVRQQLSNQGDIRVIVDPRLRGNYDTNSAWKAVEVATTCTSKNLNDRPSMIHVVSELSQCLNMEKSRKNEGYTTDTIQPVKMPSFGLNNAYIPSAR